MKIVRTNVKWDEQRRRHSYGVADQKGRAIGCEIRIGECDLFFATDDVEWSMDRQPAPDGFTIGHHWVIKYQTTRDGEPFGASQDWRFFESAEAMESAIAKYLKSSGARFIRQWGQPEAAAVSTLGAVDERMAGDEK